MAAVEKIKACKLMYSFLNEFEVCEICKLRSEVFFFTGIHMAQAKLDAPVIRENSLKGGDMKSITRGQLTLLRASFQCVAVLLLDPRC